LITTLIFALLAHGVVILGVGFVALAPSPPSGNAINIILATSKVASAPRRAAYLARVNQRGPGNSRRHALVRPPARALNPFPNPGYALAQKFAMAFPIPAAIKALADASRTGRREIVTTRARSAPSASDTASHHSQPLLRVALAYPLRGARGGHRPALELPRLYGPHPSAAARTVKARAAIYAPYLLAWQRRIERIGSAQFARLVPADVQRGELTLAITLAADGTVRSVAIVKRSRHSRLDAAALKIIRLAAPFAPFPPALKARAATLGFTYRWHFIRGPRDSGTLGLGSGY
jgi:protein TonB